MNALHVSDAESARRREDMLRELNLYPLWQLRSPAAAKMEAAPVLTKPDPAPLMAVQAGAAVLPNGHGDIAPPDYETRHARFPLANPPPERGGANEALREIHVNDTVPGAETRRIVTPPADIGNLNWRELGQRVKNCTACELRAGCLQTVFGAGDENADWLFVGSWPTEDDEGKGEVFAGQAGQLLDNMLNAIRLKRGNNVYLANVVKCSGSIRRGPRPEQVAKCSAYLMRQIQLVQPKLIVALGHSTATALLGEDREWNSLLGKVHEFRGFAEEGLQAAIPLIITHHPAALLLSPMNKAQAWRDLCLARDTMLHIENGGLSGASG